MRTYLDYSYVFDRLVALLWFGLVPVVAGGWAHLRWPRRQSTVVGVSTGAVAFPFSLGLYATLLIYPVTGLAGLLVSAALMMLHAWPGLYFGIALGLFPKGVMLHGVQHVYLGTMNAVIWGAVYGTVGAHLDRRRTTPSNPRLQRTALRAAAEPPER
jgi:hypothetical protein